MTAATTRRIAQLAAPPDLMDDELGFIPVPPSPCRTGRTVSPASTHEDDDERDADLHLLTDPFVGVAGGHVLDDADDEAADAPRRRGCRSRRAWPQPSVDEHA